MSTKQTTVVFISGFLNPDGWDCRPYYLPDNITLISLFPSSVMSIHDRVIECFYELIGGQVNYGYQHSEFHGHDCYGKVFTKGKLSNWGEDNPVILVGHSYGGVTARALHSYLATNQFEGYETTSSWVTGIITVNSPLNGALATYLLGAHTNIPPVVTWGSPGFVLSNCIHLADFFGIRFISQIVGCNFEYWSLHMSHNDSFFRLLLGWLGVTVASNTDNAAYDMTLHSQRRWGDFLCTYPNTYYLSITGSLTYPVSNSASLLALCWNQFTIILGKSLFGRLVCRPIASVNCNEWFNEGWDGLLSSVSQTRPIFPSPDRHPWIPLDLSTYSKESDHYSLRCKLTPGVWYVCERSIEHFRLAMCCQDTWDTIFQAVSQFDSHSKKFNTRPVIDNDVICSAPPDKQELTYEQLSLRWTSPLLYSDILWILVVVTSVFTIASTTARSVSLFFMGCVVTYWLLHSTYIAIVGAPQCCTTQTVGNRCRLLVSERISIMFSMVRLCLPLISITLWFLHIFIEIPALSAYSLLLFMEVVVLVSASKDSLYAHCPLASAAFVASLVLCYSLDSSPSISPPFFLICIFREIMCVLSKCGWIVSTTPKYHQILWTVLWAAFLVTLSLFTLMLIVLEINMSTRFIYQILGSVIILYDSVLQVRQISESFQIWVLQQRIKGVSSL